MGAGQVPLLFEPSHLFHINDLNRNTCKMQSLISYPSFKTIFLMYIGHDFFSYCSHHLTTWSTSQLLVDSSDKHESCQVLLLWLTFCLLGHSFMSLGCVLELHLHSDSTHPGTFGKHSGYKFVRQWTGPQNGVLNPFLNIFQTSTSRHCILTGPLTFFYLRNVPFSKHCNFKGFWHEPQCKHISHRDVHMLIVHVQFRKKCDQITLNYTSV